MRKSEDKKTNDERLDKKTLCYYFWDYDSLYNRHDNFEIKKHSLMEVCYA